MLVKGATGGANLVIDNGARQSEEKKSWLKIKYIQFKFQHAVDGVGVLFQTT